MANHEGASGSAAEARSCRPRRATALAAALLILAPAAGATTNEMGNSRLSTTLLGRLEPGGGARLAVRWDGPAGAGLDVWADLDGDGAPGPGELVVASRPLSPGIAIVGFDLPAEAPVLAEPRLWVRARGGASSTESCSGASSWDACAWQPGFGLADLDGRVRTTAVHDDGSGPALYAGGDFTLAGGIVSSRIAAWRCEPGFLFGDGFESGGTTAWSLTVP